MPAGRPLEPAGDGRPRWMAAGCPPASAGGRCTESGVQAGSPVAYLIGLPIVSVTCGYSWHRWSTLVIVGRHLAAQPRPGRPRAGPMVVHRRRDSRKLRVLIHPVAVDPHSSGAGFWPPVKLERPTGRTSLTGGQVPARPRPGRRRRDGSAEQPPTRAGLWLVDSPTYPGARAPPPEALVVVP